MFPFFEVNAHEKELYEFAFHHYFDELKNVLQTFKSDLKDFGLPEDFHEFRSLVRRGFVLEFLIVTVLRPVMNINNPEEIMKWYRKLVKYEKMKAKGGVYAFFARKKPKLPPQESVFQNPRYMEFLQFYFKIATALGAFQELGLIYFELMKDGLFKNTTKPPPAKPKLFSKPWFKNLMSLSCVKVPEEADDEDDEDFSENNDAEFCKPTDEVNSGETEKLEIVEEAIEAKENLYEPIAEPESVIVEEAPAREVREPTPPDPLRTLAAQLHQQFAGYRATFNEFETVMDDFKPIPLDESEAAKIEGTIARATDAAKAERKLSREEELELVKNMSNESAWSHVVSEVMKEKKQSEKDELKMKIKAENSTLSTKIEKTEYSQKENLEIVSKKDEIDIEKTLEEEKTSESAGSSERMMRKISRDIDMSNQKVLETIEFLSSTYLIKMMEQYLINHLTMMYPPKQKYAQM